MTKFSRVEGGIDRILSSGLRRQGRLKAMHIGIFAVDAALVSAFGNSLPGGLVAAIEFHLIQQLLARSKELSFLPFLKEFLMLLGPVRHKHTAAGGDFEGARGVLIRPDFA